MSLVHNGNFTHFDLSLPTQQTFVWINNFLEDNYAKPIISILVMTSYIEDLPSSEYSSGVGVNTAKLKAEAESKWVRAVAAALLSKSKFLSQSRADLHWTSAGLLEPIDK